MVSTRHAAGAREAGAPSSRLLALVLVWSWFLAGPAAGQPANPEGERHAVERAPTRERILAASSAEVDLATLVRLVKPRVRETLAPAVKRRLSLALPIAVEKVHKVPACHALFTSLGADGVLKLANLRYHHATWPEEEGPCQRGNAALQIVGTPDVRLCKLFGQLDTDVAALILIHEALHSAGLGERPLDPTGLTAGEISLMVKKGCGP